MRLKYRVVLTLLSVSFALDLTANTIGSGFAAGILFIVAMFLFFLSLSIMIFADKNYRSLVSILGEGFLSGLIH